MVPITSIEDALAAIRADQGRSDEFLLPISDTLLDPAGVAMAIVTDEVLAQGWMPDGYDQRDGFRIYRYRKSE